MPEPHAAIIQTDRDRALGYGGATIWITGLPGAGKTTLATALERALVSARRPAFRLDGDVIRRGLCSDLGFDRESRRENVRRAAHVAVILAQAGVIAIVALISPYEVDRRRARELHSAAGIPFIEVFVDTPVEVCRSRDPKGLYARATRGELSNLTGVGDAYEAPAQPEVRLDPGAVETSVESVYAALAAAGVIAS